MRSISKQITTEIHFKALFKELSRLETDCKILMQWADERGLASAKTLAVLIGDSLESLGLHLSDIRHLLGEDERVPLKRTKIFAEGAD